jgi:hypothetical protein
MSARRVVAMAQSSTMRTTADNGLMTRALTPSMEAMLKVF